MEMCLILNLLKCDNILRNYQEKAKRKHHEDSAILNVIFLHFNHVWDPRMLNICTVFGVADQYINNTDVITLPFMFRY